MKYYNFEKPDIKKVITLTFRDNQPIISGVNIFIGPRSNRIKNILKEIENINPNEKINISIKTTQELNKEFGNNWKKLFGLDINQAQISNVRSASRLDEDNEDNMAIIPSIQYGGKAKPIKKNIEYNESEEDLINLINASTSEDEEIYEKIGDKISDEIAVMETVEDKTTGFFNFIYDFIFENEKINEIKKKIYAYMNISIYSQHLFYIRKSDIDNELEGITLGYKIITNRGNTYNSLLLNMFNETKDTIVNIPIDPYFISQFEDLKTVSVKDFGNILLNQYQDKDINTFYCFDLNNIVNIISKSNVLIDNLISNPNIFNDFYTGFIVKYFPLIEESNLINVLNEKYDKLNKRNIINDAYYFEQVMKMFKLTDKEKIKGLINDFNITLANLNFYNKFIDNKVSDIRIINNYNLFNYLELNDNMVFIAYRNKNKVQIKVFNKFYKNSYDYVSKKWINHVKKSLLDKEIMLKMRKSSDPTSRNYNSYISLIIYETGNLSASIGWKQYDKANEKSIEKVIEVIKTQIEKINKINRLNIFRLDNNKLFIDKLNTHIDKLNISTYLNLKLTSNDYNLLKLFIKYFSLFIDIDTEKSSFYSTVLYLKYKRSGYKLSKGPKIRLMGKNEIQLDENEEINKGISLELSGTDNPQFKIEGVDNFEEANDILNIFIRIIYLYLNYKSYPDLNEFFEPIIKNIKNENTSKIYKGVKSVKILQQIDPKLFNYSTKSGKFDFYSRLCQSSKQPMGLSDQEIAAYKNKNPNKVVLRVESKTREGTYNNYVCKDPVYKFPGFIAKEKHPSNYCLPCCFKKDPREPKSAGYNVYQQCISDTTFTEEDGSKYTSNRRYLLQWKSDEIPEGRLAYLPSDLMKILNGKNCKIGVSMPNMIERNTSCVLISGMVQDTNSLPRAIATALIEPYNYKTMEIDNMKRIQIMNFWENTINNLKKHPKIFNILENGQIKKKFIDIDTYISYLKKDYIDIKWTYDLLSNYNSLNKRVNIIIFNENKQNNIVSYECSTNSYKLIKNMENPKLQTIFLIKSEKRYYYLSKISITEAKIPKIQIQRLFSSGDGLTKQIKELITNLCEIKSINKNEIWKKQYGIEYMPNILELIEILKDTKYKITGQILGANGISVKQVIINNILSFPVNHMSLKIDNVKEENSEKSGNINQINDIISIINKKFKINLEINKKVVYNKKIIGVLLNNHYYIPLLGGDSKLNKLPEYNVKYNIHKANKYILDEIIIPDGRVKEVSKMKKEKELFNIFEYQISQYIFKQLNTVMRKDFNSIFKAEKTYNKILAKIDKKSKLSMKDYNKIKELLKTSYKNKIPIERLMEKELFDFDNNLKKKIEKANEGELKKIIEDISKKFVIIKDELNEGKCYWKNDKCYIILTSKLYKDFLKRINTQIYVNDIYQFDILENNMDYGNKFIKRPTETLLVYNIFS